MKIYINLSAGLLQDRYKGEIIRIQSSHLESHAFDRLFYGLSDSLLYHLAMGKDCLIVDCSSNNVGKVIKRGIPIIIRVLKYLWFGEYDYSVLGEDYLKRILVSLDAKTKKKLRYYKIFRPTKIKLGGVSIKVAREYINESVDLDCVG